MTVPVTGPVLVIGSGLLGASVGLALRRAGVSVWLDDMDRTAVAEAVERGAGEAWLPGSGEPRIVVVAVPPGAAGQAMADASALAGATVTDVTSVKAEPLAQALACGADAARLVGGHPMAGRETAGARSARQDLFDDRPWVITPLAQSDPARVQDVRDLALTCGAVPMVMSAQEHDRAVALTSHAPQVLSSLLAARLLDADSEAVAVSGQGLRDMTRIAESDPDLWRAILDSNADSVAGVLEAYARDLDDVISRLRQRENLTDTLARGVQGRQRIPGKHGAAATAYEIVPVIIRDEPGQLAQVFAAAGELDVNLEDVRIDHVLGKPSGLVELSVRPEASTRLCEGLRALGFDVRA